MTAQFADFNRQAAADGVITDEEILTLRQSGWADGHILREEAEAIFALQHALSAPTETWSDFFVEALRTYVLNGSEPRGYASQEEGEWLIRVVAADGKVCSLTEFELLVQVIEMGSNVPERLKAFVLETLEREVLTGTGPTRCGGDCPIPTSAKPKPGCCAALSSALPAIAPARSANARQKCCSA